MRVDGRSIIAFRPAAIWLMLCFLLVGCGANINQFVRNHAGLPNHRALALARDAGGAWAGGQAWGKPTEQEAIEAALAQCVESQLRFGVRSACTLYSVDDRLVYGRERPPEQRPVGQSRGLNGTYSGEIIGNSEGRAFKLRVTFTIVQSGDQVAGAWSTTGGSSGTVTGVLTASGIRPLQARQVNPCTGEFAGVGVIEGGGNTLRGSYVGNDCSGAVTASFVVNRQ